MSADNRYTPDYAVHPGEVLEETLVARGFTRKDAAQRCGISSKHLNQILHGKAPVLPDLAVSLESVLGVSADLWTNLQCQYELHRARSDASESAGDATAWLKRFPLAEMIKRAWIPKPANKAEEVSALLRFFGVANKETWETWFKGIQAAYRRSASFRSQPESVSAWLRKGEIMAQEIACKPFDAPRFKAALGEVRKLTVKPPSVFEPEMKKLCEEAGVALVLLSELPGTRLSGAARWLNKDKALVMLSLRYKSNDHFWFSFFHEAGHICLHGKRMLFLDDEKYAESDLEREANDFAANALISEKDYGAFTAGQRRFSRGEVEAFARRIGVAPGVIVGRLQHDKLLPFKSMNKFKEKFTLRDEAPKN
jgi:HTH-type transcriptional regulator / antitoxin HigA